MKTEFWVRKNLPWQKITHKNTSTKVTPLFLKNDTLVFVHKYCFSKVAPLCLFTIFFLKGETLAFVHKYFFLKVTPSDSGKIIRKKIFFFDFLGDPDPPSPPTPTPQKLDLTSNSDSGKKIRKIFFFFFRFIRWPWPPSPLPHHP